MINAKKKGLTLRQWIIIFVIAVLFGVVFYSALFTAGTIETRVLWPSELIYGMALAFAGVMLLSLFVRLVIPGLRVLSYFVTYGIILFGIIGAATLMSKNDSVKHQESDAYGMQKKSVDSFLKSAQANDSLASVMLAAGQKGNARYYKSLADKNREDYKAASVKMEKAGVQKGSSSADLHADRFDVDVDVLGYGGRLRH